MPVTLPTAEVHRTAERAHAALRTEFGDDAGLFIEHGYGGRLRIKVVASELNGMPEQEKQEVVWNVVNSALADKSEDISVIIAYGFDEL